MGPRGVDPLDGHGAAVKPINRTDETANGRTAEEKIRKIVKKILLRNYLLATMTILRKKF